MGQWAAARNGCSPTRGLMSAAATMRGEAVCGDNVRDDRCRRRCCCRWRAEHPLWRADRCRWRRGVLCFTPRIDRRNFRREGQRGKAAVASPGRDILAQNGQINILWVFRPASISKLSTQITNVSDFPNLKVSVCGSGGGRARSPGIAQRPTGDRGAPASRSARPATAARRSKTVPVVLPGGRQHARLVERLSRL